MTPGTAPSPRNPYGSDNPALRYSELLRYAESLEAGLVSVRRENESLRKRVAGLESTHGTSRHPEVDALPRELVLSGAKNTSKTDGSVKVAVISALGAILAASLALFGVLSTDDDPTYEAGYCTTVVTKYKDLVQGRPEDARFLTSDGPNGKSIVESDESATKCGLTNEKVVEMSRLPK